jgi:uncharacterized phage-like protein YoqJ
MKCAFFTGHRHCYPTVREGLQQLIRIALDTGIDHFYCGMALGTDLMVANLLLAQGLEWTAVLPCPRQDRFWPTSAQALYQHLLSQAPARILLAQQYHPQVYALRNQFMVSHSQLCLAVYDGRPGGGTAMTLRLAIKADLTIHIWNPLKQELFSM